VISPLQDTGITFAGLPFFALIQTSHRSSVKERKTERRRTRARTASSFSLSLSLSLYSALEREAVAVAYAYRDACGIETAKTEDMREGVSKASL
jgi:hypothetical protein